MQTKMSLKYKRHIMNMICPNCNIESGISLFCHVCDTYLPSPAEGVKASLFRRLGAFLCEIPILIMVALIGCMTFNIVMQITNIHIINNNGNFAYKLLPVYLLIMFISHLCFSLWFLAQGQTPGKWLMDIRAVDKRNGSNPGLGRMLLREILGKPISTCFFCLGWFWAIWDNNAQAWHDKLSGTVVLYHRTQVRKWMLFLLLLGVFSLFLGLEGFVSRKVQPHINAPTQDQSNKSTQGSSSEITQDSNSFKWSNEGLPAYIVNALDSPDISPAPGTRIELILGVNGEKQFISTPYSGEDDCGSEGCNWVIKDAKTGHKLIEEIGVVHKTQKIVNGYYDLLEEGKWNLYLDEYNNGKYIKTVCYDRDSFGGPAKLCNIYHQQL